MYNIHKSLCTIYTSLYVQYAQVFMYNIHKSLCTIYTSLYVQYTQVFMYNMHKSLCAIPLLMSDFNRTWIYSIGFSKNPQTSKCHEESFQWQPSRIMRDGRTDRHNEANSRFSQFLRTRLKISQTPSAVLQKLSLLLESHNMFRPMTILRPSSQRYKNESDLFIYLLAFGFEPLRSRST